MRAGPLHQEETVVDNLITAQAHYVQRTRL